MKHEAFGQSDPGRARRYNEDAFLMNAAVGLYVVCDGYGGPPAGELACTTACSAIETVVGRNRVLLAGIDEDSDRARMGRVIDMVSSAVSTAGRQVYAAQQTKAGGKGGCTVAMLLLVGRCAVIAHAGDCRVYLVLRHP